MTQFKKYYKYRKIEKKNRKLDFLSEQIYLKVSNKHIKVCADQFEKSFFHLNMYHPLEVEVNLDKPNNYHTFTHFRYSLLYK